MPSLHKASALALLGMTTGAMAAPVTLRCNVSGQAAQALCAAMAQELQHRGHPSQGGGGLELLLTASQPRATVLHGRLDVIRDGVTHQGQRGSLSIIDRQALPSQSIRDFAAALLDRAASDAFIHVSE